VTLDDFDAYSRKVPVIANIRPSGDTYLMEDFYYAGGMRGLMKTLADGGLLHLDAMTVSGQTVGETWKAPRSTTTTSSGRCPTPSTNEGALAVLQGQPGARWLRHQAQRA
jgi:dihydroxyacid dehydratase/phosphogluconate dehydratase